MLRLVSVHPTPPVIDVLIIALKPQRKEKGLAELFNIYGLESRLGDVQAFIKTRLEMQTPLPTPASSRSLQSSTLCILPDPVDRPLRPL